MEDLDPFFREFNVLHTEAAESGLNSFPAFLGASFNKTSGDSMVIILWLGGLCIFLFALLVLVLSLVCINVNFIWLYQIITSISFTKKYFYKNILVFASTVKICQKAKSCNCWSSTIRRIVVYKVKLIVIENLLTSYWMYFLFVSMGW